MKSISCINLRIARKGLVVALVLFVCMGTAVSGAVAVSCETGDFCMDCMPAMHTADTHMADHMPISQGCSSNMQDFSCSLYNIDLALGRQIAISDTVFPSSEFPLALSVLKVESESAAAKHSGLPLPSEPLAPTIPIYLKTLSFLC
jgi:hypothetical protein